MKVDVIVAGLVLAALGVLFLVEATTGVELRPGLLWPLMLIAWGTTVLVGAATTHR